jgi:acetylornithine deacetylase
MPNHQPGIGMARSDRHISRLHARPGKPAKNKSVPRIVTPSAASLDLIGKLIAFDTTSRNSNLALIGFVRDYLDRLGVESRLVPNAEGNKANLYATLGPPDKSGIALSGHTDVVPVDGQAWTSDPWQAVRRDGRLYGRGACDMKGFLGVVLALAPEFLRRGLHTPIHLAFSYDEEVGCVGVRRLLDLMREMPVKPKACIIGEPTGMKVTIGHKGKKSVRCHVRGVEAHSSLAPRAVNAVEMAAEVIVYLRGMARRFASEGPFDEDYDVPHTTVHTGVIHGGTALNIVPKDCQFDFEFRFLPDQDGEAMFTEVRRFAEEVLQPAMHAIAAEAGFGWTELSGFPGLATPVDAEIVELAKALSGGNATIKVAFGAEGGLYHQAGIPAIICGPGSIEQAHKPDEWVTLEQLALCEAFLRRLMDRVCIGAG